MARISGLLNRSGRFYLQIRVPQDIRGIIGKEFIKRALHTSDRKQAIERLAVERVEVEQVFTSARRMLKAQVEKVAPGLTDSEAQRLAYLWFREREKKSAEDAFKEPETNPAALNEARFLLGEILSGDDEALVVPLIQGTVDQLLREAGFPTKPAPERPGPIKTGIARRIPDIDKSSAVYQNLCDQIKRGMIENLRRQQQRLQGQPTVPIDPGFAPEIIDKVATAPNLSEILDKWLAERKPPVATAKEWQRCVNRLPATLAEAWGVGTAALAWGRRRGQ